MKRRVLIDLETTALTPERGEVLRLYARDLTDPSSTFDQLVKRHDHEVHTSCSQPTLTAISDAVMNGELDAALAVSSAFGRKLKKGAA